MPGTERSCVDRCAFCGVVRRSHDPAPHAFVERDEFGPDEETTRDFALEYLDKCGLVPTPDAVSQLTEVFLPCLAIMCQRGYDPEGGTWKESGRLGALADARKKFMRLWEQAWRKGRHDDKDHALDCINFLGFYIRHDVDRWGEWGEPAPPNN